MNENATFACTLWNTVMGVRVCVTVSAKPYKTLKKAHLDKPQATIPIFTCNFKHTKIWDLAVTT